MWDFLFVAGVALVGGVGAVVMARSSRQYVRTWERANMPGPYGHPMVPLSDDGDH